MAERSPGSAASCGLASDSLISSAFWPFVPRRRLILREWRQLASFSAFVGLGGNRVYTVIAALSLSTRRSFAQPCRKGGVQLGRFDTRLRKLVRS